MATIGRPSIPDHPQLSVRFARKRGDSRYAVLEGAEPERGPYTLQLQEGQSISGVVEGYPDVQKVYEAHGVDCVSVEANSMLA